MSFAPRSVAFFIHVAATGWFEVGFAPITKITSDSATSETWLDTAPEPMPSSSATTDDAWQRRVQWSTLLVPKPVRTSFWRDTPPRGALGAAEAGERVRAFRIANLLQARKRRGSAPLPRWLRGTRRSSAWVDGEILGLGHARLPA